MSQVAFIVKLELNDTADKAATAEDIHDSLLQDGFQVLGVNAWSSPNEAVIQAGGGLLGGSSLTLPSVGNLGQ